MPELVTAAIIAGIPTTITALVSWVNGRKIKAIHDAAVATKAAVDVAADAAIAAKAAASIAALEIQTLKAEIMALTPLLMSSSS